MAAGACASQSLRSRAVLSMQAWQFFTEGCINVTRNPPDRHTAEWQATAVKKAAALSARHSPPDHLTDGELEW
jgi:hypothetical protein